MVNQKLIEWINSQESKGYSDKQLREFLIKKKYKKEDIDEALKYIENTKKIENTKSEASQKFDFWDKIKYLFINPKLFFDNVKGEKIYPSVIALLAVYAVLVAIQYGISFIYLYAFAGAFGRLAGGIFGLFGPFMLALSSILVLLVFGFFAGIVHLIVMIFSGQGRYKETFKAIAYSSIPATLISSVPMGIISLGGISYYLTGYSFIAGISGLIGLASMIYSLVLMTIGVSRQHNISYAKAATAVVTPIIFFLGIFVIWFIYAFRSIRFYY